MTVSETKMRLQKSALYCLAWLIASSIATHSLVEAVELKTPDQISRVSTAQKPTRAKPGQTPARWTIDQDVENNVLQMVNNHLPEVKILLDRLRDKEPRQYNLAIRDLARSARRLQVAKKRGEESFELEVEVVQNQSSINVLIAKLRVRDNKSDRKALREAAMGLQRAEAAQMKFELAQLKTKLARLQEQVTTAELRLNEKQSNVDENIEKSFQSYLRKSGRKD